MIESICKSTFIYDGTEYKPGDSFREEDEEQVTDMRRTNLIEAPMPAYHQAVTQPEDGDPYLIHRGGGWYNVTDKEGYVLTESVQGKENALQSIRDSESDEDQ